MTASMSPSSRFVASFCQNLVECYTIKARLRRKGADSVVCFAGQEEEEDGAVTSESGDDDGDTFLNMISPSGDCRVNRMSGTDLGEFRDVLN